jgi:ornithine cyclodeaminase/alanine dehydrogenase-like protein (mu-crystallin family)
VVRARARQPLALRAVDIEPVAQIDEHAAQRKGGGMEPRETIIADVNGDGINDLVLLVHDRVLVYPAK